MRTREVGDSRDRQAAQQGHLRHFRSPVSVTYTQQPATPLLNLPSGVCNMGEPPPTFCFWPNKSLMK